MLPPLPVPYMQIVSAHCVPLHPPLPSSSLQKDPGQTFIRLGIFIFRPTRRQKGVKAWRRPGAGERAAFTFFGTFDNGFGDSVVSKTIDTITEEPPSTTMGRRKPAGGSESLPLFLPSLLSTFPPPLSRAGFPLSPSPQRAREIMKGGGGRKAKKKKRERSKRKRSKGSGGNRKNRFSKIIAGSG